MFASIAVGMGAIRLIFWLDDPHFHELAALLAAPIPAYWAVR